MIIKPFLPADADQVQKFTDREIGKGYYSVPELLLNQKKSVATDGTICSFLLIDEVSNTVKGLRLAFPPGNWTRGKGLQQRSDLWPYPVEKTAYFQSLFLAREVQGEGWGPKLSTQSIDVFKKLGALGIATHSWLQSPHNSSVKYLEKMGFKKIIEHPLYWIDVDYTCPIDGKPCLCTAMEMYLILGVKGQL